MKTAVACAAGSLRGVFVHGVLAEFEKRGFRADAYACASSSSIPAAQAAAGRVEDLGGTAYWRHATDALDVRKTGVSGMILESIEAYGDKIEEALFGGGAAADGSRASRFLVAVSEVVTPEAAAETQGEGARRLGKRLLIEAARKNRGWTDANLAKRLFDTKAEDPAFRLSRSNLREVLYATTRMLHAWEVPAWVGGRPFVDASYTCSCPAVELAEAGFGLVVAVSPEPGPLARSLFGETVPESDSRIVVVRPDRDLKSFGVDFLSASEAGFEAAFAHGRERAAEFLDTSRGVVKKIGV